MKNPDDEVDDDVRCELPPEAMAIIEAMPRSDARIFPYSTDAISAAFTRACAFLGIVDLHFHDLRHCGVTRLFEMGRTVPLAASASGTDPGRACSATRISGRPGREVVVAGGGDEVLARPLTTQPRHSGNEEHFP